MLETRHEDVQENVNLVFFFWVKDSNLDIFC